MHNALTDEEYTPLDLITQYNVLELLEIELLEDIHLLITMYANQYQGAP